MVMIQVKDFATTKADEVPVIFPVWSKQVSVKNKNHRGLHTGIVSESQSTCMYRMTGTLCVQHTVSLQKTCSKLLNVAAEQRKEELRKESRKGGWIDEKKENRDLGP